MKIGFTGTRHGMTQKQAESVEEWFTNEYLSGEPIEVHQGCCVGADEEFAAMMVDCFPRVQVVGHPSNLASMTSSKAIVVCKEVHPPAPPLERNRDIVRLCGVLIATPAEMTEQQRGGTWSTIRWARKMLKRLVIVLPDGSVKEGE